MIGALLFYGLMTLSDSSPDSTALAPEPEPALAPVVPPRAVAVLPSERTVPSGLPSGRLANPSAGQLEVRQLPAPLPPPPVLQPIDPAQMRVEDPVREGARLPMQRGRSNPRIGSPPVDR